MDYFYTQPQFITSDNLTIEGDEFNHLTHVMRKKIGDRICVVDGVGTALECTIKALNKQAAACSIEVRHRRLHESETSVTLAVGMLKNPARFDFLVEKATELGVSVIVPMITERTIARQAKTGRWRNLSLAAMKQSCRCVLPEVRAAVPYGDWISGCSTDLRIIPHNEHCPRLSNLVPQKNIATIAICIGPEGGFSDDEVRLAESHGFLPVSLGPRRFRTETAAIVAMAQLPPSSV